jgi:hypothetical protein
MILDFACLFWHIIKEYAQSSNIYTKSPFATHDMREASFYLYTSSKTTYGHRLNAEVDMRIQMFSIKQDRLKRYAKM